MLDHLIRLSRRVFWLPVGYLGLRALLAALEECYRKSELSCDRAGLLAGQDPAAALRAQMKLAGGAALGEMDITAFLDPAREYDATGSLRDGVIKLLQLEGRRATRWRSSGPPSCAAGSTAATTSASSPATIPAAAASYRDTVGATADSLLTLLRGVGEEVVGAGARMADRVRQQRERTGASGDAPGSDAPGE